MKNIIQSTTELALHIARPYIREGKAVVDATCGNGHDTVALAKAVFPDYGDVAATLLFFKATDMVKHNPAKLAVIEATQSGEVVFTILLGVVFLHDSFPDTLSLIGIIMIIIGMIANSLATKS